MDNIIKNAENISLTFDDIKKICEPNNVEIIEYKNLMHLDNINDVFSNYDNVIILYTTRRNYGHWVVLMRYNNTLEYFDSYGKIYDFELSLSYDTIMAIGGVAVPQLTYLLNDAKNIYKYNVIYNNVQLQKFHHDVNTCGRYCALRIKLRHIDLNRFINLLLHQTNNPDMIVTYLTYLGVDKDIQNLIK